MPISSHDSSNIALLLAIFVALLIFGRILMRPAQGALAPRLGRELLELDPM